MTIGKEIKLKLLEDNMTKSHENPNKSTEKAKNNSLP